MADNNSDNAILSSEILDELRVLTSLMKTGSPGSNLGATYNKSIEDMIRSHKKLTLAEAESAQAYLNSKKDLLPAEKIYLETLNKKIKLEQTLQQVTGSTIQSFSKLTDAILSTERSFSKYTDGLKGLGDAAKTVGDELGGWKRYLGNFIKGSTEVAGAYFKQADSVLKANDDLAKLGTAGSFSTKELLSMAHNAYLTSKNMDLLTKPIQSLGSGLINLGGTTGEGVKVFAKLTAVTQAQQLEYQKLGVSQGELIQTQSDFLKLQAMSGANLRNEAKDKVALQKASLAYQDQLLELAALTGEDVENIKKKQQDAARIYEFQIGIVALEAKAKKAATEEERQNLQQESKNRRAMMQMLSATGDKIMINAYAQLVTTGVIAGKESQQLMMRGLLGPLQEMILSVKQGANVTESVTKFLDKAQESGENMVATYEKLLALPTDMKEVLGITPEVLENMSKRFGISLEKTAKDQAALIEEAKKSNDPALVARATLTGLEQKAAKAYDEMLSKINPLISGLSLTSAAGSAAAAALMGLKGVVTDLLTGRGGGGGGGAIGDLIGGLAGGALAGKILGRGGAAGTAAGASTGILSRLAPALKVLSRFALPLTAGYTAYQGYKGFTADENASFGQKILNAGRSAVSGLTGGIFGTSAEDIKTQAEGMQLLQQTVTNSPTGGGNVLRVSIVDSIPLNVIIKQVSDSLSRQSDVLSIKPDEFTESFKRMIVGRSSTGTSPSSVLGGVPTVAGGSTAGGSGITEDELRKSGINVKTGAHEVGGSVDGGLIKLMQDLSKSHPITVTSIKDNYHSEFSSAHNQGQAFDFTIPGLAMKPEYRKQIIEFIKSQGFRALDEYSNPSPRRRGSGHIHVQTNQRFAQGGMIFGPGTSTSDSVPAYNKDTGQPIALSTGEYVLPASITQMIGKSALDSLISSPGTLKRQKGGVIPGNIASVTDLGDGKKETVYADGTMVMSGPDGSYYYKNGEFIKYVSPSFAGMSQTIYGGGETEKNYSTGPLSISESSSGRKSASYDLGFAKLAMSGQGEDINEASISLADGKGGMDTVSLTKEQIMQLLETPKTETTATTGTAGTAEPVKEALTPYLDKQNDTMTMLSTLFERMLGALEEGNGIQKNILSAARI